MEHEKYLPFSLDRARAGAKIVNRNGEPINYVAYVSTAKADQQVVARTAEGDVYTYTIDGSYRGDGTVDYKDLFMLPEEITLYVNLYRESSGYKAYPHTHERDAAGKRGSDCIATQEVTFTLRK